MVPEKRKIGSFIVLCGCIGAVGLLWTQRAAAVTTRSDDGISHVCFGEMDFDFRAPKSQRSIWVGEHDSRRMKGCTYEKYAFESALPGKRFVVAGTGDRQTAVVVYVNRASASKTLAVAVKALQHEGFVDVGKTRRGAVAGEIGDAFSLLNGERAQLQVVAVPYLPGQSMLVVVRTQPIKERSERR